MFNAEFFRQNKDSIKENLKKRNFYCDINNFQNLDFEIKKNKKINYKIQYKHNLISSLIEKFKKYSIKFNYLIFETINLKKKINEIKKKINEKECELEDFLSLIPNIINTKVPIGKNENDNLEIRIFKGRGLQNNKFINDLEGSSCYIDFDCSAKLSGSGFVILKKEIAELHRAVGNYMIDFHINENGYEEIYSPLMVNSKTMFCTGHLPKFKEDLFNISEMNLWLIPTSEVVLSNIISTINSNEIKLPLNYVSKTPCFRKEKGNYGSKVKGLIRQHQFEKIELVKITNPENSYEALEELVFHAEKILQNLNIPYRIIMLCSGDLGFTSSKTYDIEAWLPKRKKYMEVSSCSNTENFQSTRMKKKIKNKISKEYFFPHILNGSGLAVGRVLLSIIENYSDEYGNLSIPDTLISYMNGKKKINFQ